MYLSPLGVLREAWNQSGFDETVAAKVLVQVLI
jgi:hypothetical protein